MRIITSGGRYLDIDAYASCIAYAELLNLQGQPAKAASSAKPNESVPESLRNLRVPFDFSDARTPGDSYTLIDISDPNHFDPMVDMDRIDEVIDHHPGFEMAWRRAIGNRADIQLVGAAATLIYERWARVAGVLNILAPQTAMLLAAAILDNTLNFQAQITSERDRQAFRDLMSIARLPDSWPEQYFSECQKGIERDLESAIRNDTKIIEFEGQPAVYAVGQIVIWDAQSIINDHYELIKNTVSSIKPTWFMNVVSIKGDRSYFVCDNPAVKTWLSRLLGIQFSGNIAPADRLWLRKEILVESFKQHKFQQ